MDDDKGRTETFPGVGHSDTLHANHAERYCPTCDDSFVDDLDLCPKDGTSLIKLATAEANVIGKVIDNRFTIKAALGSGGMGTVYRGLQHSVGREVAIKLIQTRLSRDPVAAKRFLREAKLCSRLSHSNSVTIIDFGQCQSGELFMVMELLAGQTLGDLITLDGAMSTQRTVDIMLQVCAALEAAHAMDIIHRDLKPSNIMLAEQGDGTEIVKVLDFGLARSLAGDDTTVTQSGAMMGTPQYMAPEIANGERAGAAADLYSLGIVMYEMLAGTPPFHGETVQSLIVKHASEQPPPLPDEVPARMRRIVERLMRKQPGERFGSASELRAALKGVTADNGGAVVAAATARPASVDATPAQPEPRGGRWKLLAIAGVVAAAIVTAVFALRGSSPRPAANEPAQPHPGVTPATEVDAAATAPANTVDAAARTTQADGAAPTAAPPDAKPAPKRRIERKRKRRRRRPPRRHDTKPPHSDEDFVMPGTTGKRKRDGE